LLVATTTALLLGDSSIMGKTHNSFALAKTQNFSNIFPLSISTIHQGIIPPIVPNIKLNANT